MIDRKYSYRLVDKTTAKLTPSLDLAKRWPANGKGQHQYLKFNQRRSKSAIC